MRDKILIMLLMVSSISVNAQTFSVEERKVNEVIIKMFDGIAELDFSKISKNATKDMIVLESGAIWNLDSLTARLAPLKKTDFKRTNKLDFIKTEVKANTAWVYYNNTAEMLINGKPRNANWLESAVLVKEGNDWKIKLLHSTTVKPNK
ncbi:nuclear transport factor 2 family protein [Segetibacter aerophilus]|uniref:DUF4440 domain-containing protein n=1 Tax=Segetibacter aerophilus TaxID=670293 RepID=A0A512B6V6_9BACT|nr:nuclear transport factor 2 family protein [Segetibacter aerophilus]GEO07527.1 hypothetical protein SAE01_00230 [Segetibacter aerophilus]